MAAYAQGYRRGAPIRMTPGVLGDEAYGVRTTAADMLRFVQANIDASHLDPVLARAIAATQTGYFRDGSMTQDLIWEQYPFAPALGTLLAGNSGTMILDATPVTRIAPPQQPGGDVWINKTGSTNGFGAYIAFAPRRKLGIVILANENFPIRERVTIAYSILTALSQQK